MTPRKFEFFIGSLAHPADVAFNIVGEEHGLIDSKAARNADLQAHVLHTCLKLTQQINGTTAEVPLRTFSSPLGWDADKGEAFVPGLRTVRFLSNQNRTLGLLAAIGQQVFWNGRTADPNGLNRHRNVHCLVINGAHFRLTPTGELEPETVEF